MFTRSQNMSAYLNLSPAVQTDWGASICSISHVNSGSTCIHIPKHGGNLVHSIGEAFSSRGFKCLSVGSSEKYISVCDRTKILDIRPY